MHNKSVEWCFIKCRASLVIECAKLGYRSVGVELNLPLVIYSRMATRRNGFFNNEATFYRRDIFKTNMKPYNVSILFAAESVVEMILPKLEEMRPGTHLVMCRFPIPTTTNTLWTLVDREGDGIDTAWLYRKSNTK